MNYHLSLFTRLKISQRSSKSYYCQDSPFTWLVRPLILTDEQGVVPHVCIIPIGYVKHNLANTHTFWNKQKKYYCSVESASLASPGKKMQAEIEDHMTYVQVEYNYFPLSFFELHNWRIHVFGKDTKFPNEGWKMM